VYAVAACVERHTGLVGYDLQLGCPLSEAGEEGVAAASQLFDNVARSGAEAGIVRRSRPVGANLT
jgi:hypothetical protein